RKMPAAIENVPLYPHPTTPSVAVTRIEAQIYWTEEDRIATTYKLQGDCARIHIAQPGPARRADGLWHHTCFEMFLLKQDGIGYFEFNYAPSSEWAMYNFKAYRDPAPLMDALAPEMTVHRTSNQFELAASIELPQSFERSKPLCVALAAVIEEAAGARSYWA